MKLTLLMLSEDKGHFIDVFRSRYPQASIDVILPSDFESWLTTYGTLIRRLRKIRGEQFVICCDNLDNQLRIRLFKLVSLLVKSKKKYMLDKLGRVSECSLANFLFVSLPLLVVEGVLSVFILVVTCLLCFLLSKIPRHIYIKIRDYKAIAYLMATLSFGLKVGGSVTHISGFARGILRNKYNVFFISSGQLAEIDSDKTPIKIIKPFKLFNTFPEVSEMAYNLKFTLHAYRVLKNKKVDFLYQRYVGFNFSGIMLGRLLKIPLVLEVNSPEIWIRKNYRKVPMFLNIGEMIEEINFKRADLIVVVSNALKRILIKQGVEKNKILVNPNGTDPDFFTPLVSSKEIVDKYKLRGKIVVGFASTFLPFHGAEVLVEAIPRVIEQKQNIHFLLMGFGPLWYGVEKVVKARKLDRFVTLVGAVPYTEMPKYLAACDIFASPHVPFKGGLEFFGSPTKLFEYMAMEKGIVASNLGQIGEVLKNNENAYLIQPGNKEDLVGGILKLASDKTLRERLGRQARKDVVTKYTWQQNALRVIKAYERLRWRR